MGRFSHKSKRDFMATVPKRITEVKVSADMGFADSSITGDNTGWSRPLGVKQQLSH